MTDFYRYESDPCIIVNLDADMDFLKERQKQIQEKIAKLSLDHQVITEAITKEKP